MQILLGKGGMQPPNLEFKKGLKVSIFSSPNAKFS